ncbi:MAG: TatD family hydrolase [Clostridia bacterium]|nr:TatD family hydrolase [Clostridia bacterium]MBQ8371770.1 TatD family hydrolase [Clostridia bacterium]
MKYFDSHAHYYDERFDEEYTGSVDELIDALLCESVSNIINVGTSPDTCRLAVEQAKKHEGMYTAIGIHPSDTRFIDDMDSALAEIEEMIKDPESKCVILGEIGLDYHYPDTDRERQAAYFEAQMQMAERLGVPVCIHDRDAHGDVMDVLRKHPTVKGILHSFSGSAEMALELVGMGYMISFSGTLTFTNAKKPKEVALAVPRDMVLIETDCPYLAPHPKRGTLNHSGNLVYTNATLASLWGVSEEECARITAENARRIFGL